MTTTISPPCEPEGSSGLKYLQQFSKDYKDRFAPKLHLLYLCVDGFCYFILALSGYSMKIV